MIFQKIRTAVLALLLTGSVAAVPGASCVMEALAASSLSEENNTAVQNDLENADIIDVSKTGSLTIHKYDMSAAEAAGVYECGSLEATGESDSDLEKVLDGYGMAGVQFTLMRVGNVETYSVRTGAAGSVEVVYEIPEELAEILQLSANDAVNMTSDSVAEKCDHTEKYGLYHYTGQQIADALKAILDSQNITAKNNLEGYLYDYGTMVDTSDGKELLSAFSMDLTDQNGETSVDDLALGLYLAVETEVPEQVTETVDPFFVQLPFTNVGGEKWVYDMVVYPKNQSGNPTLDKSVRNAYSNTLAEDKNGTVNSGSDYVSDKSSTSLIVWNDDSDSEMTKKDESDAAYVSNRGGYTLDGVTADADGVGYSYDYEYRDTTTASEGDVLDFILVSRLPHITSSATYLSEYTFVDTLSAGLIYNEDAKIAFYDNEDDANANNTADAVELWTVTSGQFQQGYASITVTNPMSGVTTSDGTTEMTITMTEAGLEQINGADMNLQNKGSVAIQHGLSDYYMVVYYTATVKSDADVVLGDDGNPNDVSLKWSRTSDGSAYYSVLNDRNYVYTYALDLTKTFSDENGQYEKVQFKLYNSTDCYYVKAEPDAGGVYYVTGKTTDEGAAATFVPDADTGRFVINGLEADTYTLTEVATDDGYTLLKDQIQMTITAADRDIIAAVSGVTGLTAGNADEVIRYYHNGIYDENGNLINNQSTETTQANIVYSAGEAVNGRPVNGTDMYVGGIVSATATVDGVASEMAASGTSEHAVVEITVNNAKKFLLPQTGGKGLYLITVAGVVVIAGGIFFATRKKKSGHAVQ